jgi:hypothetical protein
MGSLSQPGQPFQARNPSTDQVRKLHYRFSNINRQKQSVFSHIDKIEDNCYENLSESIDRPWRPLTVLS